MPDVPLGVLTQDVSCCRRPRKQMNRLRRSLPKLDKLGNRSLTSFNSCSHRCSYSSSFRTSKTESTWISCVDLSEGNRLSSKTYKYRATYNLSQYSSVVRRWPAVLAMMIQARLHKHFKNHDMPKETRRLANQRSLRISLILSLA